MSCKLDKTLDFYGTRFSFILYPDSEDYDCDKILTEFKYYFPEFAYILHDKDKNADGTAKKPHIHFIAQCNKIRFSTLCNRFPFLVDMIAQVQKLRNWKNSIQYLVHYNDPDKASYKVEQIISNFDITPFFKDKDESSRAILIYEFITTTRCYSTQELMAFCFDNNLYSEARRGFAIWSKMLRENEPLSSKNFDNH